MPIACPCALMLRETGQLSKWEDSALGNASHSSVGTCVKENTGVTLKMPDQISELLGREKPTCAGQIGRKARGQLKLPLGTKETQLWNVLRRRNPRLPTIPKWFYLKSSLPNI